MNIRWLFARAGQMSPPELAWRSHQFWRKQRDAFSLRPHKVSQKAALIRELLPPVTGSWPITYFKAHSEWRGGEIFWQDPVAMASRADLHWSRINYRDTARFGDPKVVWELNRHQFLKDWVTRSDVDLPGRVNAVTHLILDWIEKNPAGYGMNWCSSLELALRLVSWEAAIEYLGDENFHPRALRVIHRSVAEHVRHLRRYPSLFSSANNHRIGELLGEMAAASIMAAEARILTAGWLAWQAIEQEANVQIFDGVAREKALFYHTYDLLFFRKAVHYAEGLGFPVPPEFRRLIERMQEFLNACTDEHGHWFEIGDRDDGNLKSLLPWTNGSAQLSIPAPTGFHFSECGFFIWKTNHLHALMRGEEFGYPSIAAHAHCDQLSVVAKLNGEDFLTDSGTGSYHDNARWRRYFRGTTAHNTVRLFGMDQADYGGPFLWKTAPYAPLSDGTATGGKGELTWKCASRQVTHSRNVEISENASPLLVVTDVIQSSASQDNPVQCELIWNFGPNFQLEMLSAELPDGMHFKFRSASKSNSALVEIQLNVPGKAEIFYGDDSQPAGFYSRQFGERKPIYQLRIVATGMSVTMKTAFTLETLS